MAEKPKDPKDMTDDELIDALRDVIGKADGR